jgi:phosphoribosylformimino-5-aminoimidazole carboxamide ribotide isomerase
VILLPAIDIRGGHAVRLEQGEFDRETVYDASPLSAAVAWVDEGARALHVVDLDGAREGRPQSIHHLRQIAAVGVRVQYGGGLRTFDAVREAIDAGAARVVLGTAALRDPDFLDAALAEMGDRVRVAVDVRGGRVSVEGWTETTDLAPQELVERLRDRGVPGFVHTDADRDGMLAGPDLDGLRGVAAAAGDAAVTCSGGVGSLEHLASVRDLGLENLEAVISGKALYERRFTVEEGNAVLEGAAAAG